MKTVVAQSLGSQPGTTWSMYKVRAYRQPSYPTGVYKRIYNAVIRHHGMLHKKFRSVKSFVNYRHAAYWIHNPFGL